MKLILYLQLTASLYDHRDLVTQQMEFLRHNYITVGFPLVTLLSLQDLSACVSVQTLQMCQFFKFSIELMNIFSVQVCVCVCVSVCVGGGGGQTLNKYSHYTRLHQVSGRSVYPILCCETVQ